MKSLYLWVFILLAAPFYLNDFSSIYVEDWRWWLLIDYVGVKLFPCLVVLWLFLKKKMCPAEFGLTNQRVPSFLVTFIAVALVGALIDQNGYALIDGLPGYAALGGMPAIADPTWDWIDLTFGLFMVGVFEELVFRAYMHTVLSRYIQRPIPILVISSVAFGLIHWSLGLHAVLITSLIGAVFMVAYLITRSLPAIALAHFTINFIDFADVIPKSIFRFS